MINHKEFAADLYEQMKALAKPDKAKQMKSYMKDHFDFLGVSSVERKVPIRTVISKYLKLQLEDIFPIMNLLWDQPHREMQYVAMDISKRFCKKLSKEHLSDIIKLITKKSWWDTVDFLAVNHLGGALYNTQDKGKKYALSLIDSDNMWLRRSALLYQLKYKSDTDFELLSTLILATIHEKEFFIRKAQGWALREYSKTNKVVVGQFIQDYEDQLSTLAKREGGKYV